MRTTSLPVAVLASLLATGCHYYLADDDAVDDGDDIADDGDFTDGDDGFPDVDAGVYPDASPLCDPAAILPAGWLPVEIMSTATVTNQVDPALPEVFTTIVDASAGGGANQASQPFVYLDLEAEGGAALWPIDDVTSFQSTDWDIALKRFVIRSNSGDSGPADVEVATISSEGLTFSDVVPSQSFADDDWTSADCELQRDSSGGPRTRFSNWYQVSNGRFEPKPVVHLVRLGGGRYAEIDIENYYGDEANPARGGVYILRWRRF